MVDLRGAVDRLEGRTSEPEAIDPNEDYGDVQGRVDAEFVRGLLPKELSDKLRGSDARFEFHFDATEQLMIPIDAFGNDDALDAVRGGISDMLASMRTRSLATNDERLRRFLESASIRKVNGGFQLEATVPNELVKHLLGKCAEGSDADDD